MTSARRPVECGVHRQQLLVDPGQLAARIDAELVGEAPPGLAEDAQRLGLPAAPVQGDHQQPGGLLAQRVGGRERGQLGHRRGGLPLGEQQIGPLLDRRGAQLGEPPPLRLGERAGHPGVRQAAPERKRLVHRPRRAAQVAGRAQPARRAEAPLEMLRVESAGTEPEQVAAAPGDEHPRRRPARPVRVSARPVRFEHPAQTRHIGVNAAFRAGRRLVSPDRVDQLAARDHPVRAGGEHPEDCQLPRLPGGMLPAVPPDRHRPENSHSQRHHRQPPPPRRATSGVPLAHQNYAALPDGTATEITGLNGGHLENI